MPYPCRRLTMLCSSLPPFVCRRAHVLFTLFVFACTQRCPKHIVLCFCFVFRRLVYHMLTVSLYCPFLIAPSVFSNVYFPCVLWTLCCRFSGLFIVIALRYALTFICPVSCVPYVASFTGLSIFDCSFSIL